MRVLPAADDGTIHGRWAAGDGAGTGNFRGVGKPHHWSCLNMSDPRAGDKIQENVISARRRYDSPLRRERAQATRDRILAAGCAMAREFPTWDWRGLTAAAVADRAGVNKTTVYRHFSTEREMHDAIMRRLEDEAGVSYDDLELTNLTESVARAFAHLASFAVHRGGQPDPATPTLGADRRHRDALLRALTPATVDWPDSQRQMAAAVLDLLWSATAHQRLMEAWGFDADRATNAITWGIDTVLNALTRTGTPRPTPPA
jgi:AcrR family transcriptional regulator